MTELEFDRCLKQALLDAIEEDWAQVEGMAPALDFAPSPAYGRKIKRLLSNPKGALKRAARPMWKRMLRSAACLLLTVSLALGAVMAVNPSARAAVIRTVRRWFATYTDYTFSSGSRAEVGAWTATYLPDGFEQTQSSSFAGATDTVFENPEGLVLYLSVMPMEEGFGVGVDNEHSTLQHVEINGNPADLYVADTAGGTSQLIWTDEAEGTAFLLYSTLPPEELVRVGSGLELSQKK